MRDFAKPYKKVQYFGLWAEETADQYGKRDAMAILADAAGRCFDEDMRQRRELLEAFDYLAQVTSRNSDSDPGALFRSWRRPETPQLVNRQLSFPTSFYKFNSQIMISYRNAKLLNNHYAIRQTAHVRASFLVETR